MVQLICIFIDFDSMILSNHLFNCLNVDTSLVNERPTCTLFIIETDAPISKGFSLLVDLTVKRTVFDIFLQHSANSRKSQKPDYRSRCRLVQLNSEVGISFNPKETKPNTKTI